MVVSAEIIALSLAIISLGLNAAASIYWFPVWRREKSGMAHALFLLGATLAIGTALKLIQIIFYIIDGKFGDNPFNIAVGFFAVFAAVIQFALSRGYFNWKE